MIDWPRTRAGGQIDRRFDREFRAPPCRVVLPRRSDSRWTPVGKLLQDLRSEVPWAVQKRRDLECRRGGCEYWAQGESIAPQSSILIYLQCGPWENCIIPITPSSDMKIGSSIMMEGSGERGLEEEKASRVSPIPRRLCGDGMDMTTVARQTTTQVDCAGPGTGTGIKK